MKRLRYTIAMIVWYAVVATVFLIPASILLAFCFACPEIGIRAVIVVAIILSALALFDWAEKIIKGEK